MLTHPEHFVNAQVSGLGRRRIAVHLGIGRLGPVLSVRIANALVLCALQGATVGGW